MTKKLYIVPVLILISAAVFFAVRFFLLHKENGTRINTLLQSVDMSLGEHAYRDAYKKLQNVDLQNIDLVATKRYLKRVYEISRKRQQFTLFTKKTHTAVERYPHDRQLQFFYLFSLLQTGAYDKALVYSQKNRNNTLLDTLTMELFLLKPDMADTHFSGSTSPLLSLSSRKPYVFKDAAAATKNPGFMYDEALLYLTAGEPGKAYNLLEHLPEGYRKRNTLLFFSAFENKKYKKALEIINTYDLGFTVQSIMLFTGDLMMHLQQFHAAEQKYIDFIQLYPKGSWIPYANLAWIASRRTDTGARSEVLQGLHYFPDSTDLLYSIVSYLVSIGDFKDAVSSIKKYGNDDPTLKALSLRLQGSLEPALLIAKLQEIVLKPDVPEQVKKFYCWFLVKTGNVSLLSAYLSSLKQQEGNSQWFQFFSALAAIDTGNFSEASDLFEKIYTVRKEWTVLFDAGLLQYREKNYKKAIELFQNAENAVSGTGSTADRERSQIRTFTAFVLEKAGNKKRAVKELHYALDLDASNMKAILELEKLDKSK